MVVEDDIEPREACVDRLLVVLHAIAKNPKVTQMAMLAGSEAPRMVSLQRGNSTSIHNCERLLDVRTYPAHWVDNTFVVPFHVGMGLKWYLISPEGRKALLKMRDPEPKLRTLRLAPHLRHVPRAGMEVGRLPPHDICAGSQPGPRIDSREHGHGVGGGHDEHAAKQTMFGITVKQRGSQ